MKNAKDDDARRPTHCEIRLKGHLDARWSDWLDGLTISHETNGTTLLAGPVADQSALHGLLAKIRDLGLPLVSINLLDQSETECKK